MSNPKPEPEPGAERDVFDQLDEIDPEADARRLAAAEEDIAAGRVISP